VNKTKIEWVKNPDGSQGYTVNPVKGKCPMGCDYCYMWGRLGIGMRFHFDQTIRYDPRAWLGIGSLRKPSRIFVGSTIELFHDSLSPQYLKWVLEVPLEFPQHTFIFLTKCPQNLPREWPDNCWVGVTATNESMAFKALSQFLQIEARIKYLSLEPMLGQMPHLTDYCLSQAGVSWLIIGAQTNPYKPPEISWVREIVEAADKAGVKVFLKDNLYPLLHSEPNFARDKLRVGTSGKLRQEMPSIPSE